MTGKPEVTELLSQQGRQSRHYFRLADHSDRANEQRVSRLHGARMSLGIGKCKYKL
jgi:hypothetical protein